MESKTKQAGTCKGDGDWELEVQWHAGGQKVAFPCKPRESLLGLRRVNVNASYGQVTVTARISDDILTHNHQ